MGLKHDLLLGIVDKNFHDPSPVQEECIPLALAGKNHHKCKFYEIFIISFF